MPRTRTARVACVRGRLLLDELVTATYPVEDFERAAEDAHAGKAARAVLTFQERGRAARLTSARG
ncbi:hypothetical protein [Streptomyces sp. NPDC002580]|uniref:hypothetical protein n=1 Tax=Streptomyces sp. NPDC002580 TaxID=3364653 RepID=UPI0036900226